MAKVSVNPDILKWARDRVDLSISDLAEKITGYDKWETEEKQPTFKQLQKFARITRTPFGFFFLKSPPSIGLPINDFRTPGNVEILDPSPDLLATIHIMQLRQDWMRDYLLGIDAASLPIVNSSDEFDGVEEVSIRIRSALGMSQGWASVLDTWANAFKYLRERVEAAGVLLFINGVVGNNTSRKLNKDEFKGFALVDEFAPLVFINNADFISSKIFTLIHEVAHIAIGKSGVSNLDPFSKSVASERDVEKFCNSVAAEVLVPTGELQVSFNSQLDLHQNIDILARQFKVSDVVIAIRLKSTGLIEEHQFQHYFDKWKESTPELKKPKGSGGSFWSTNAVRISPRFGKALAAATKQGEVTYQQASRLSGLQRTTFKTYVREMGV